MTNQRIVVETDDPESILHHDEVTYHGTKGNILAIQCDDTVYTRVWTTKAGDVVVNIDHEETELEGSEILETKIYNE